MALVLLCKKILLTSDLKCQQRGVICLLLFPHFRICGGKSLFSGLKCGLSIPLCLPAGRGVLFCGLLSEVFANPQDLDRLEGTSAIGHVRYGTSGNNSIANVQPFLFHFHDGDVALAHNGNLTNAKSLKQKLEDEGIFDDLSVSKTLIIASFLIP